ncbi:MAG: gamma-glutamylcyclotransferase family protein [Patescibacteria group bacterium]|mgnify:CR=1 FL=1
MSRQTYIFGFGSLMNEESLQKTLPNKKITSWAILKGYRRAFNKAGRKKHRYLNLKPAPTAQVKGVLIRVTQDELEELKHREEGYDLVDVTGQVETKPSDDAVIYAFIAPPFSELKVSGKYLQTMLAALPLGEREQWLRETDFDGAEVDEEN